MSVIDFNYHGLGVRINTNNQFVNAPNQRHIYEEWGRWWLKEINFNQGLSEYGMDSEVKVAVLDSGLNMNLPQFNGNILAPFDCVDNTSTDNFGDPYRYEINEDGDNPDTIPDDYEGHGTAVISIIAAQDDAYFGINPFVKIVPVRCLYRFQDVITGSYVSSSLRANILAAIDHAINQNVDIINMSLGGYSGGDDLKEAIKSAYDNNICIVAATGNDNSTSASYPASYNDVLAVSSSDITSKKWHMSNHGMKYNNFVTAPGSGILALHKNGKWYQHDGTSLATPIVSGIMSLIIAIFKKHNYSYTSHDIYRLIRETCRKDNTHYSGSDFKENLGAGIVDAKAAIEQAKMLVNSIL